MANGTSGNMMKASAKRRRSRAQVLEDKAAAMNKDQELQEKMEQLTQLHEAMKQMQA